MDAARLCAILNDCIGEIDKKGQPREGTELVITGVGMPLLTDVVNYHSSELWELLSEVEDRTTLAQLAQQLGGRDLAAFAFAVGKLLGFWRLLMPDARPAHHEINMMARARGDDAVIGFLTIVIYAQVPTLV